MFIPGILVSILTFPGVIVHEFAHKVFCQLARVHVYEVCYFRIGNPVGYVRHAPAHGYGQTFLIVVAPFIVNSLIAFGIFIFALTVPGAATNIAKYILYWLGISIAMNSFPSSADAEALWRYSKRAWRIKPLALVGFPVVILIKISNILSIMWFDLFYTIGLLTLAKTVVNAVSWQSLSFW